MTAITALHARLNLDASMFSEGAELTRSEVNKVAATMRQSVPPAEKYQRQVDLLDKAFSDAGKQSAEYANAIEHLRQRYGIGAEAARRAAEAERQKNIVAQQGKQLTQSLLTPQERYNRKLADYQRLANAGAISSQTYGRAVSSARKELDRANASTSRANTSSMSLATSVRTLAGAYVGLRTVTQSIKLAIEVEQAEAAFEVLTGSAQTAAAVLADVRSFSETSPISFRGATEAAKMMMAFNIPVQEVGRNIRILGDISMGNQQRFDSLTLAFSQMSAAGRLMGQDLLQMINAGFNPLQEISARTGETIVELKKRMEEGAISADEVTAAFQSATSEGGRFDGMAEKLASTMGGQLQIALSNLEKAGARAGEAIGPLVIALTDGFNEGQSAIDGLVWSLSKFADGIGFLIAVSKDGIGNVITGKNWSITESRMNATNKFLDDLDKRNADRKNRANAAAPLIPAIPETDASEAAIQADQERLEKQQEIAATFYEQINSLRMSTAELQLQSLELSGQHKLADEVREQIEAQADAAERAKLEAEGYSKLQIEILESQRKINRELKEKVDREKQAVEEAKKREEAFANEVDQALAAAKQYFEQERQRDEQRRQEISAGPGVGIEVGSAGAAKFMADQVNAQIGAAVVPEKPTPGEKEIADKTRELLLAQRAANAEQARQSEVMRQQLAELKENRFTRIR